jgi:hypothetical protein
MVVLGTGDSVPVIMELNPKDGNVYKFISLQKIGATSADQPKFYTFGAIYHDIPGNNQRSYYYAGFVMNNIMQVVKIDDQPDNTFTPPRHTIAWNY